jgi:HlyD family secretion protein
MELGFFTRTHRYMSLYLLKAKAVFLSIGGPRSDPRDSSEATRLEGMVPGPTQTGMDRVIVRRRWTRKRIIVLGVGAVLLVLAGRYLAFHSGQIRIDHTRVVISEVRRGRFLESIPVTGTVAPMRSVYLDAIEGGRVETIHIDAGAEVEKGDKILTLSNTILLSEVMYREADLLQQANNLRNTRLDMEQRRLAIRTEILDLELRLRDQRRKYRSALELKKRELIPENELARVQDEYEYLNKRHDLIIESGRRDSLFRATQVDQLEASLERMEDNLELMRNRLETLTIRAPVSGLLSSLSAEVGQNKALGDRLGQIDVAEGFKIGASVDEHYLPQVATAQEADFTLSGQVYQSVVSKVYPEVAGGRFQLDLEFVGATPPGVRRGQTVHMRLNLSAAAEAVLLDRGSFYEVSGGWWVYVVDESGDFAVKRPVKLGRRNPDVFEVLEGLTPGEKVITSSYRGFGNYEKLVFK